MSNRQKWRSTLTETLRKCDHVWLIEDSSKRGYYNLGRVKEAIDGSDGVIRSTIFQTNDRAYKRPIVKLTTVQHERDVFAMENSGGNVVTELTKSTTKLNSTSRPFQAVESR